MASVQPASGWIPVDTFLSAEEAADAVAEQKTGVIEWDYLPDLASLGPLSLSAWQASDIAPPLDAAPPLSEEFKAAWRRLYRRPRAT